MEDDCQRYQWDCSDWASQAGLPKIIGNEWMS